MAHLMSQTEYAAHRGVRKSAVSNWKSAKLLVFADDPNRPGKQLVDVEKSDLIVRGSIDQTRGRPRSSDQAQPEAPATAEPAQRAEPRLNSLEAARLEEMQERTRRRKIETEQLLGQLVPVAEYERRAGDLGRLIRERTNAVVRQMAERLAAETDPRQIAALLSEEFDRLFNQVADEVEADAAVEHQVDQQLAAIDAEDDAEAGIDE